jgi:outer membrane lipoprotein
MRRHNRAYGSFLPSIFLLCCCTLIGCSHTVSREFRQKVIVPVDFRELVEQGEAYKGERVILGGHVLEVLNEPGGTLLNVLQAPLDSQGKPKSSDLSEGRFLVRTARFLDPEIFSQGRRITVGGRVVGVQTRPTGKGSYQYPVIEAEELHLLPKYVPRPAYPYPYYWHYPWYSYPYWHHPRHPYR